MTMHYFASLKNETKLLHNIFSTFCGSVVRDLMGDKCLIRIQYFL